ncbi:hypothetical protein ABVT39_002037 [Epinephelus coioides]
MGDKAIPHTDSIETPPMTDTQLVITPTDLRGMKGTGMTDGIPRCVVDHLSAVHVATPHHPETTQRMDALLNAMRTDIPLVSVILCIAHKPMAHALQVVRSSTKQY